MAPVWHQYLLYLGKLITVVIFVREDGWLKEAITPYIHTLRRPRGGGALSCVILNFFRFLPFSFIILRCLFFLSFCIPGVPTTSKEVGRIELSQIPDTVKTKNVITTRRRKAIED